MKLMTAENTETNSSQMQMLSLDEVEVLEVYRKAKQMQFADVAVTVQEGKRVKLWLTEKKR
jgi:hypothetical protein